MPDLPNAAKFESNTVHSAALPPILNVDGEKHARSMPSLNDLQKQDSLEQPSQKCVTCIPIHFSTKCNNAKWKFVSNQILVSTWQNLRIVEICPSVWIIEKC